MAPLPNAKKERFAQELAKGKSATEAMNAAGYADPRNSTRLTKNDEIRARVAELQERSAKKAEITVDTLRDMLLEDRALARELGQSAAAVSAVDKLGKLYGHMIERKEIGKPGDFSRMTEDELDAYIASGQNPAGGGHSREEAQDRKTRERKPSGLH